jgi:adenylylsulfate kinase|tara:strand:- start:3420 stop:4016 length:597 start_codon:yes stop_codon:yes gene_type:complete
MKPNVIPHLHAINQVERTQANGHQAKVIWFVGLSGSGKSTLAGALETYLFGKGYKTYVLDGDNIRSGLNSDLDFSEEGRHENIRRISEVAKLLNDAGMIVLTAFISPFEADRAQARTLIGTENFIEIFVECPIEICEKRDVKGLYAKARKGLIPDFTGISAPFEVPDHSDLIVKTHTSNLEDCLKQMVNYIEPILKLK